MKSFSVVGRLFAAGILMCAAFAAQAQQLQVATGSPTGTYSTQLKEITQFCSVEGITLIPVTTSGSIENLDLLINNKVNAAWVQSDLLYRRSLNENLDQVKTLLAMHPEQLHWIALTKATIKQAGTGMLGKVGMGGSETPLTEVSQLAGLRVGAWGGSIETAKQVRLDSEIAFELKEQANFKGAKEQLDKGTIDAILMVGGAPMTDIGGDARANPPVAGLSREYRLLATSPALAKKISNAYQPARISYTNLGAAGIPTVAVNALFVTRNYTTPKMQASLGALRSCVQSKLAEIKETTGTHPSWQSISADNKGTWGWYNIPSSVAITPVVQTAPAAPAKKK